jgi:hypothetical protein
MEITMQPVSRLDAKLNELDNVLTDISSGLGDNNLGNKRTIQEVYFVSIFLPLLYGDVTVSHTATLKDWINYAGGPYNSVDVVDAVGKVLFEVPSFYERNMIATKMGHEATPIAHILKTAQQYSQIHPVQGEMYLEQAMDKKTMVISNVKVVLSNLEKWDEIFMRYGKPSIMAKIKNNTPNVSNDTTTSGDNDELIYED